MIFINLEPSVSPRLEELIQEANHSIHTAKEKILAAYNYAIETDRLEPKVAAKILREKLDFSDRYIREVLPLEAKELKFTNKSTTKNNDEEAEQVPPNKLQEQYQESSNKVLEESDSVKVNITTAYDLKEVETMDATPSTVDDDEIETFNDNTISTTITTNDEHQPSSSSTSTITEPDEFLHQYNEMEIARQMLYNQRQENRYLVNEIRNLRGLDPQTIKISHEKEAEEIEDEKINLSVQNDTKRIAEEIDGLNLYDGDKVIEFIEHWDQIKRLFRELVEIELYQTHEENTDKKLSIQDAIHNVLYYLEYDVMGLGKKLKFPDGLARYISQYFIDQETERYLRIKFRTSRINDDTLGFKEWRKELAKTPKQRREDKKLFLEQCREDRKRWCEQLKQEEGSKED